MKRIVLSCIGLCVAIFLGELIVRIAAPQHTYTTAEKTEACYITDPVLYTTLYPQAHCKSSSRTNPADVYINSLGFRDYTERKLQKQTGTKRVLFIGDSYTFGHGVRAGESFPYVVESLLQKSTPTVEVFNAGIPGVGPDWYFLFLKDRAFALSPDLIVVNFYLGNDLNDYNYFTTTTRDSDGLPIMLGTDLEYVDADHTRRTSDTPWQYTIPLLRTSHLFIAIANRLSPPIPTKLAFSVNGSGCYLKPDCTDADSDIEKLTRLAAEMKRIAHSKGVPIVFTLLPWEAQLPRKLNEQSKGYLIPVTKIQRHAISDKVGGLLRNNAIEYIDLLDAFDAYTGTDAVYTPTDYHWNATGHRIAADYLAPKLETILFPPIKSETE